MTQCDVAARHLANLYSKSFGGKESGRFRMSAKQVRELLGKKRLYADDIAQLARAVLEQGYVLIDMDSFFVLLSANAFVNYRRVSGEALATEMAAKT
ncbi:hypothetical protein [Tateyamaria omphalii]|uniref:Uncharacterized protein n=1 Tax=Tateyamaria omphalii TaxID=299262 RepID=A0A1P8MWC9_9RHOB|nr:hypothetical protein [Tateyamaria omphalii]APX12385.1 hypothetical protein BWR18_12380 [Tateyamaria omphalii]